ncbi:hypothetical protein HDU76_005181, partial [Blyttiomyces sp. JEL0837]
MTQLQKLNLGTNAFTGSVPDFSALTNLKELRLDNNYLTGAVPASLGNLASLQLLTLDYNQLNSLPSSLANLKSLTSLDIGVNTFSGDLPGWIMGMSNLTYFSCWGSGYSGAFPDVGKLVNMVT